MTPFQKHAADWRECTRCPLHRTRNRVCLVRGTLPADVLFVGEAPGQSEDVLGQPFVGPAGRLLDAIVARATADVPLCTSCGLLRERREDDWVCPLGHSKLAGQGGRDVRLAFTNLVGCVPVDPETGAKAGEPDADAIQACMPRLEEIAALARPRLVAAVGRMAADWVEPGVMGNLGYGRTVPRVHLTHPAAILRDNPANREVRVQQAVLALRGAVLRAFGKEAF